MHIKRIRGGIGQIAIALLALDQGELRLLARRDVLRQTDDPVAFPELSNSASAHTCTHRT
jgi:hypothetical protein